MSASQEQYFTYDDCDLDCRIHNISCTITMINDNFFPCTCYEKPGSCLDLESEIMVCLRPNSPAVGGSAIWESFRAHRQPSTIAPATTTHTPSTTQSPTAAPHSGRESKLFCYAFFSLLTMNIVSAALVMARRFTRKRQQHVSAERLISDDNPYQPTVQEL